DIFLGSGMLTRLRREKAKQIIALDPIKQAREEGRQEVIKYMKQNFPIDVTKSPAFKELLGQSLKDKELE
ncbi:hypothetical protein LCGC14_2595930, partial [marine sediment metagenome]